MYDAIQRPKLVGTEPKHSGFGIASFVLAVLALTIELLAFVGAGYLAMTTEGELDGSSTKVMALGLAFLAAIPVALVGGILGVVGIFESDRRRTFAAVGVALGVLAFIPIVALFWFGGK